MVEIDGAWPDILAALARGGPLPPGASELFQPFLDPAEGRIVVGQFGQSIDGRIATPTGDSKYINGPDGLRHLHRLRALVDAVVVGVSTAVADDPGLDVRHCSGRSPARVVIDPRGRVPPDLRLFREDGARRIVLTDGRRIAGLPHGVEIVHVPATQEGFDPASVIEALAGLGLRRLLIEGGAYTVSRFLCAGALDRLHVIVAPFLIGAGPTGISMPTVRFLKDGIRPPTRIYPLGEDVLFDCDLAALRAT